MIAHAAFIGTLSLSLITTFSHASPLQSRDRFSRTLHPRDLEDYTSKGCYTEATIGRALTGNAFFDDRMTLEKCAAACTNFLLFGVEYGRECFCGDALNDGSVSAPEEQCSFECPGKPDEKCGAGNRLNVYEKVTTAPVVTTPTVSTYQADGCYTEASSGRALSGKTYYDDAMTIAKCASACAGFDLFGLEYYRECYCGNKLQAGSVTAPANECYHPCTGDKTEVCGGDNRLNLYTFGTRTTATPPASTSRGYAFDGCFTEATQGRALTGSVYYDNAMTVEKCSVVCKGFTLFGVEYGRECYCGDTLQAGSEMVLESECNFPCPGNDAESCGAGNRLDVYRFGASATTSSSSSTVALTTTSSSAGSSSPDSTSTLAATTSTESLESTETSATSIDVSTSSMETTSTSTETPTSIETSATGTETTTNTVETSASTEIPASGTETTTSSIESSTVTASTSSASIATTSSTTLLSTSPTDTLSSTLPTSASSTSSSDSPATTSPTTTSTLSTTSSTTSPTTSSSTSTSSVCTPSPTQVISNPSFEQDLDGSRKFTFPWSFGGIGANSVQDNRNNAYQSYDGTHFAYVDPLLPRCWNFANNLVRVLYGRSSTTASLSQTVNNLIPGNRYTLQYFYNVPLSSLQTQCVFTAQLRGQVIDTIQRPPSGSARYISRSVTCVYIMMPLVFLPYFFLPPEKSPSTPFRPLVVSNHEPKISPNPATEPQHAAACKDFAPLVWMGLAPD
ncbi:MAG: hypothetical protein Q9197_005087 [Variospora fuerteventurae]